MESNIFLRLAKRLKTYAQEFIGEVLGIITSQERQKQFLSTSLYKNTLFLVAVELGLISSGLIFWIIVARFYPPRDVGIASAALSIMTLLATLSTLGLEFGLMRFLSRSSGDTNSILNSSFTIGSLTSIISCSVFLMGLNIWSPELLFLRQNIAYLIIFVVVTITGSLSFLAHNAFIAQRHSSFAMIKGLIFSVLRLPLPVLLAASFGFFGIFVSWGIAAIAALIISIVFLLPKTLPGYRFFSTINRSLSGEMVRFSLVNYFSNLFWFAPGMVLPIMVLNVSGAESNAYFNIAWTIGNSMMMIAQASSASLFAEGSYDQRTFSQNIRRSLKLTFFILVPAVIVVLITADKLLILFGGAYSQNSTTLLRILALSTLPMAMNYIFLSVKRVEKRLVTIIELSAFVTISALTMSYVFLRQMGINGVGIAWLVSHVAMAVWIIVNYLLKRLVIPAT